MINFIASFDAENMGRKTVIGCREVTNPYIA